MADNEDRMPSDARGSLAWDVEGAAKMEHHYGTEARAVQLRAFAARARQLEADVSRLTAALDRVRDDAERLDTVEAWTNGDTTICPPGNHGGELINWLVTQNDEKRGTWEEYEAPTLREAIDAARTQQEGSNG